MGTFEAPNDYRSYLMHYGVKGMKWRNHRRSQMNKNFRLPGHDDSEQPNAHANRPRYTGSDRQHNVENTTNRPRLNLSGNRRGLEFHDNGASTRNTDGHKPANIARAQELISRYAHGNRPRYTGSDRQHNVEYTTNRPHINTSGNRRGLEFHDNGASTRHLGENTGRRRRRR